MPHQRPSPWRAARAIGQRINDPPRVLVAEDDDEMRRLVVEALRKDGYRVEEATDGGRLLIELTQQIMRGMESIDLIVSDIRMPVCTGLEIVEALRDANYGPPIILMTAFGDDWTRAQAQSLGALLFDKPFELDDLRTAVLNLLERSRADEPPDEDTKS